MLATRFCNVCNIIFNSPEQLATQLTASHHPTASSLQAAANADCYICARIWRQLSRRSKDSGDALNLTSLRYWLAPRGEKRFELNFDVRTDQLSVRSSFLGIDTADATQSGMQSSLSPSTRSKQSLQQAKAWIAQCRNRHDYCRRENNDQTLPTRLVYVERQSGSSELSAHICKGTSLPVDTPYLTLSHRWGTSLFLTLTKENAQLFHQHIPIGELPRVFQDALHTTAELGFNYIWVDSLCILQNDKRDWINEARVMGRVYRNAACNLSASGFDSSLDGFLLEKRSSNPGPPSVTLSWANIRSAALRTLTGKTFTICESPPWFEIFDGPLFDRAWVLQEQILAPRALHFGTDQVFWECNDRLANEVWPMGWAPRGLMRHPFQEQLAVALKRQPFWLFSLDKLNGFKNLPPHDIWRKIVENYSVRRLTISSDRLPALNGIASEFGQIVKDRYFCGLWEKDLHLGLLWKQARLAEFSTSDLQTPSSIPSWSWASLGCPVQWMFPCSDKLEIHSGFTDRLSEFVEYDETSGNPSIRFRGHLMNWRALENALVSTCHLHRGYITVVEKDGFAFDFDYDYRFFLKSPLWSAAWKGLSDLVQLSTEAQSCLAHCLLRGSYFLPMLYTQDGQRMGVIGLLLAKQTTGCRGVYCRVGTANMWSDFSRVNRQNFQADAWYYQNNFDESDFLDYDHNGVYDVKVI